MTRVYGSSDDLIEIEGDIEGEIGSMYPMVISFSDGTILRAEYGKKILGEHRGIWFIEVIRKGDLFDRIIECTDEDADIYSDQAIFDDGIEFAAGGREIEYIR